MVNIRVGRSRISTLIANGTNCHLNIERQLQHQAHMLGGLTSPCTTSKRWRWSSPCTISRTVRSMARYRSRPSDWLPSPGRNTPLTIALFKQPQSQNSRITARGEGTGDSEGTDMKRQKQRGQRQETMSRRNQALHSATATQSQNSRITAGLEGQIARAGAERALVHRAEKTKHRTARMQRPHAAMTSHYPAHRR